MHGMMPFTNVHGFARSATTLQDKQYWTGQTISSGRAVEFYNKAMKPDPLLTAQQGRTILRWVHQEMRLKTIFAIDSKRVDRQRQQAQKADQKRRKTAAAAIGRVATILATARGSQRSVLTHNKLAVEASSTMYQMLCIGSSRT